MSPQEIGQLVQRLQSGQLREVEARVRTLLKAAPGEGMLWKLLSVALVRQGRPALQALRQTVALLPADAEAHGNLGSALRAEGLHAEALRHLQQALALRPGDPATLVDAGDVLRALGRARESVALYEQALRLEPRLVEAGNGLGNALLVLGRPQDAAVHYRRAMAQRPQDADIPCNLGNALQQLGQFEEALAASARAIALNPRLAMAHNIRGLSLVGLGRREQAIASYRQAIALQPAYVEALGNLGDVLREIGELGEALALHRRAVELAPSRPESHCNLGGTLFDIPRVAEAVESYRRALVLRPAYPEARLGLAMALRAQGHIAEAEVSCRALLGASPDHVGALSLLGELHADQGRFEEAQKVFERVLSLDPGQAAAYYGLARQRRMSPEDREWLQGAQRLLQQALPLKQEIALRHALGKYFDDVAQYEEAFAHHRRANELSKRLTPPYDREGLVRLRERSCSWNAQGVCGVASEQPVFIIGMPRSGTSLAEQILASHPQVFGAGEIPFWDRAWDRLEKEGSERGTPSLLQELAGDYLRQLNALSGGAHRVVDKMPANFLYAGLIHAALPGARIIHMQRHPLDTCLSIYCQSFLRMGRYANDLEDLAHYYGEYLRIMAHWRRVLPATALLEVPYEGLVEDQEGWSRRMVDFIGLPWDPACLEFHQTQRVIVTASQWQVRQRLHRRSVGRWRHYQAHLGPLWSLLEDSKSQR